ncbi:ankyrin repeat domain-containing protein 10-like isoform 2-T2 [Menidia menidia]|uniref:(Atlantic silverside) hypothetical protein n=1 Tax=Menidia menidia TaxID=238744 RepID=A0A8S4BDT8_9TELE|nr:unnamed protein product [Menidia menidia]
MSVGLEPGFSYDEIFFRQFPVHRACRDGDVSALVSLLPQLSNQGHLTAEDSCYGWSPIHWAAHYGQLECLVLLVQMGCEVNSVTSRFNQTPTHTAAFGGHPHCVVWLTQAGADINKQDCVGEAPIHKAARSGSLECIQVLLIAGAKPHLRNASGQTAADLAQAHGFHDCFCFVSNAGAHLQQLGGLHGNGTQSLLSRKRQLMVTEARHAKKARRAGAVTEQRQFSSEEEGENMNLDLNSDHIEDALSRPPDACLSDAPDHEPPASPRPPAPSPPVGQRPAPAADMCGSLHLTGSPASPPPEWTLDFLQFGHRHGFGDTAEDPGDSGPFLGAVDARKQPPVSTVQHSGRF